MERAQFVDVDNQGWWLLQPELEPTLEEKRKALGASWQWTGDLRWYTDRQKMEEVFQFIEATRPDLLRELDEVQDVARREQWLDNLIGTKSPPVEAATQEAPPVAQKPATPVTAPAATPRKASAFGRRESDQDRESAAPGEAPAGPGASATAPASEPRKASPFAKKAAPVAEPAAPEPGFSRCRASRRRGAPATNQRATPNRDGGFVTQRALRYRRGPGPHGRAGGDHGAKSRIRSHGRRRTGAPRGGSLVDRHRPSSSRPKRRTTGRRGPPEGPRPAVPGRGPDASTPGLVVYAGPQTIGNRFDGHDQEQCDRFEFGDHVDGFGDLRDLPRAALLPGLADSEGGAPSCRSSCLIAPFGGPEGGMTMDGGGHEVHGRTRASDRLANLLPQRA